MQAPTSPPHPPRWQTAAVQQVGTNNLFKASLSHFSNYKQILHLEKGYKRNVNISLATANVTFQPEELLYSNFPLSVLIQKVIMQSFSNRGLCPQST